MIDAALTVSVAEATLASPLAILDLELQTSLRSRFPGVTIIVCSDDDVLPNLPSAMENERCRLFYLDASQHCVELSCDADSARGIVVCLRSDDE